MSKTAKKTLLLIALLTSVSAFAQTSVRDLVPSSAPAGARVMVTGRGLADPALAVAFATGASAAVVQRHDRYIEVVVPANAASGNVRITNGATLVAELPFTVTTTPKYIVSTHSGGKSSKNTPLKHPWGAAVVLPEGTVAVADEQHHRILLVTAAGPTTVLAGGNKQGFTNGKGAAAEFNNPRGITFDAARRVLYVSDSGNSAIREVALDGTVKTLAGSGKQGFADGTGAAAEFRDPHGLTVGADGAIYVTDPKNFRIRRVTTAGAVTTFAGNGQRGTAVGDGALLAATFNEPRGIVVAGNDFYVADTKNNAIRRISGGQVTSVLSFPRTGDDDDPAESGDGNAKVLNRPAGIGVDESGFLIVSDSENDFIRRIDPRTTPATMVTIAGTGKNGWVDGDGAVAQFKDPVGLTVAGAIYVADEDNDALRRLCPEVRVTGLYSPSGAVTAGTEVRLFGTGFVPGLTTVQIGGVAATSVTWITSTELSVNLPQNITGGSVSVTIVSCAGTAGPVSFVVDNTAPVITVTQGGTPLVNGALFRVPVTPVIAVTDDIDPAPRVTITLNGAPFVSGTTVSVDAFYTLVVTAEDAAGNRAEQTVKFVVLTAPASLVILEGTAPLHPDSLFNRAVVLDTAFTGFLDPTVVMQLDGQPYTAKTPYSVEGTHSVTARATDSVGGDLTAGPIAFTIDLTPPVLTFTSHTNNQVLSSRDITVIGGSDDAVTVSVNGIAATVDTAARTFTLPFTLNEGENTLVATGTDRAGNTGTATLKLRLDTRAPELTVAEVAACVRAESLELRGTVADPALDKVVVKLDGTTTNAVVTGGAWSATIALPTEGSKSILVEATDSTGHVATEQVTVTVDRTAPQIELSESGGAFTATLVPRPVALFVRSNETSATITATLGTTAYTSGTEIAAEGSHTIRVTARDCAGNESSREHTFAIDLTPPRFLTFTPASGTKVSTLPGSLSGTVSDDAVEVRVRGITVPATNGAFTIPNIGFTDGVNELALEVVDRAGHTGRGSYTIGIRTSQPLVDIVEGGEAMVNGTVYRRTVEPRVRVFEDGVNFTATLNGAPFTNGTTVSENGQYTISATATDPAFNQSSSITRTFTIDRSGPEVVILSPADGASINADRTDVRVTAGDSVRVVINTVAATKGSDNVWTANVPLEIGENVIVATGTDAAGNSGSDSADVTRGTAGPAIVLTFPPDNHVTNRPRLDVTGRVLRPNSSVAVTVPPSGAASAAVDPAGMFRLSGAELQEGEWTITAVATEGGKTTSAAVRVIADFTPPRVRILESGSPLADSAHFPTRAVITGDATDKGQPVNYTLVVDGNTVTNGVTISATGGHTAVITATDAAGNQARLERTFYVGSSAGGGCLLEVESFDPRDGTVLNAQKVELIGRSGGAAGVKANGVAAKMSNGSFCVPVELPQEGANTVTIVCTDAAGNPTGEPKVITLYRATNDPSITITTPAEDSVSQDETIVVTGTLSNGAISVDVNGKPATINGSNWTVTDVRLQDGVNVLVAHAKNASGRAASASRRVTYLQELPAIAISSPIAGFVTGRSRTDVSGTFSNVVPTSIAVTGVAGAVTPEAWSDTTGRFVGRDVPLQTGDNTVVVTGLDRTGRIARAEVVVRYTPNLPLIDITSPADNHYYGGAQGNTFRVEGTFTAAAGSSVDVNGVAATISGNTFSADIPFSNLPGGLTPVIARVAQPSGDDGAFDSLRVFKLAEAPKVLSVFPPANEIEVNPGAVVLVLFSAAMERASTVDAFRLENSAGTALGGKVYLDKDVLTFAPGTTLTAGERYTIKVAGSAKDLAGQSLTPAHESSFVVATTAPGTAPTLTTKSGAYCGNTIDVAGTATPGARLRLDYGQVFFTTTATPTGTFTYKIPLSGQQGFHVIRVRTMGGDGTLSPFVELKLNVDCAGPRVLGATYDRNVNTLTIVFNRDVKTETVNATTVLLERADGTPAGGPIVATGANAVVTPSPSLFESTFTLKVTTGVQDTAGRNLEIPHTQLFPFGDEQPQPGDGRGYITGEVYDATTGRPLAGAAITIEAPAAAFARGIATNATAATQAVTMITDARGRYSDRFPEGAHTIKASANGYTTVWRQIIVPAGAGVIPIDIRLTRRGTSLVHGGDKVARRAELTLAGTGTATITSTGAQSLAGLLPLGWSPLASAVISTSDTITGHLTFDVPQSELTQHAQSLTAVRYDDSRDEWRVLVPVVNVNSNKATFDVSGAGAYALVYADRAPKLKTPPAPVTGAVLQGAVDPCATGTCPELIATSFPLDPAVVLPSESTVATLNIRGTDPHLFPSGTAVQAYIDEELRLVDGGRELDPPFATDLLLYRNLAGDLGVAAFNLAPSPRAAEVTLEVGFDHIRILPYPGRLDRGTLVGPEGGRVPADEKVSVEIPTGATQAELRATATSIADAQSLGPVAGFTIVGGLNLSLQQAATTPDLDGDGKPDAPARVELTRPARATFSLTAQQAALGTQFVLVELLDQTPFGQRVFRLAAEMQSLDATRWTTKSIDREQLPVDGIIREGRYLLLAANAPVAFAKGIVRLGAGGPAAADARVTTPTLGVADLSRLTGIFNVVVPATPATPFQLTPRSATLGDGASYTHTSSPAANAIVNVGDLLIVAQPPQIASTIPAANATNVNPATTVEVTLTPGIDATSVNATTLSVIDTTTGTTVAGTVTAVGNLAVRWTMPSGNSLRAGTRYTVAVAPSLRGTNGTPLGQAHTFSFTTASVVTSNELHPERIHITIPDANGLSRITGLAGALKTGWLAVPVRRNRDFFTRYSVVANADGSFALTIGTDPRDRLTIADEIDLRVLNNAGALAALFPLTPFVSEDGKAFVVSKGRAATFTSADNITITVPEGAFDKATLVEVRPSSPSVFAAVPRIATELLIGASIEVRFDGRALKPLELSFPTPAGTDPNLPFFLAILGQSSRGPRLQAVDTLVSANGKLSTGSQRGATVTNIRTNNVSTNEIVRSNDPRDFLMRFIEAGQYAAAQMRPDHGTMAWSLLNTAATVHELHWDTLHSMYVGHEFMAESLGRVAFPVPAGTKYTVTAIDPTSSLIAFEHTYDALPVGPPGTGAIISAPNTDFNGPHPVYATPFRVESVEAPPAGNTLQALRDVELALDTAKNLTISGTGSMTAATWVSALNVNSGEQRGPTPLPITLPNTSPGDRIILTIDEKDVDPASEVSVVFNESIEIDGATSEEISDELKTHVDFVQEDEAGGPDIDLLQYATLRLDASGRRIIVNLGAPLARGADFRLTLKETIHDRSGNGLNLGQTGEQNSSGGVSPTGPASQPMTLRFKTRDAHGEMGRFTLRQRDGAEFGAVREIAQYDNLMFVAALDGGILAYDLSDPGALNDTPTGGTASQAKPIAIAPGRDSESYNPITDYWSLQIDHHGRIFSVGTTNMFGAFRSFRVEDFVKASTQTSGGCLPTMPNTVCKQSGGAIISQLPGTSYTNGLPSQVVTTDRAEATPRKIKVVVGDAEPVEYTRDTIVSAFGSSSTAVGTAGLHQFNLQIPASGTMYRLQRITIENVTLGLRWSADAKAASTSIELTPAKFEKILAGPNDVLRVTHNRTTHAVITLFGFGIGVFDVNAIESNELPQFSGGGEQPLEQVALRRQASDGPAVASADSIGDLSFSPDSEIVGVNDDSLHVYTLDSRKGVADFSFTPPGAPVMAGQLVFPSDSRWSALKSAVAGVNAAAFGRFNQIAQFQSKDGRDWLLLPNLGYGLLVVEAGPTPLSDASFADVIWHPRGAYAVRAIPGSSLAVILDRDGYAHLIDLSRIDEREIDGTPTVGLFPTAAAAIAANAPDPRILWTSEDSIAAGTGFIPPIVDPETGFMISAELLTRKMRVHSIIDPQLWITADLGNPRGPQSIGSVVPLGVEPPDGVLPCSVVASDCRASLGVFRVEARLPGSMNESTIASLDVAVESEAVPGVDTPQTPEPYPPAHLRFQDRSANVDTRFTGDKVTLKRTLGVTSIPELRYQKGWNRFASDWIVAIADPRASKEYVWPSSADKTAAGCFSCDRPDYLNATGVDSHEIYTAGRFLWVRPEFSSAGGYAFMKENRRLTTRISTVRGDLVRPSDGISALDKVAAKNLPTAGAADEGPVNLNTGEVTQSAVDLAIQGRGLDFVMQRHYSSAIAHIGPFGRNFDSPLFARVQQMHNGDVIFFDGTGRRDIFTGGTTPPEGVFLDMHRDTFGNIAVHYPDNTRMHFDGLGRLSRIIDRNATKTDGSDGNTMSFMYDGFGRLAAVVDPTGHRPVFLEYYNSGSCKGCVSKVRDYDAREVKYFYDASGRLERVEGPDPASASSAMPSTTYTWGPAATVATKAQLYASGQLESEKDGLSRTVWTVGYDPTNRWAAKTLTSGGGTWTFTLTPASTDVVNPNGHIFKHARDDDGRITALTEPGGAITTYSFDGEGRPASIKRPMGDETRYGYSGGAGRRSMLNVGTITEVPRAGSPERIANMTRVTSIGYGPANLPTSIQHPDNSQTLIERDARGNPKKIVDGAGTVTTTVYDQHGLLKSSNDPRLGNSTFGYETSGVKAGYLKTATKPDGVTQYGTDSRGNRTSIVDPTGRAMTYTVNKLDQIERFQQGASQRTFTFNAAGHPVADSELVADDPATGPVYNTTTYGVDAMGRVRTTSKNGVTRQYGYDAAGNVTSSTSPVEPLTTYGYDARNRLTTITEAARVTTYVHDDGGAIVSMTDPRGHTTAFSVSGFNDEASATNSLGVVRVETHDMMGRSVDTRVMKVPATGAMQLLRWSTREYDPAGRVLKEVRKLFTGPLVVPPTGDPSGATDVVTTYEYDDERRTVTEIDPRGGRSVVEHDELERPVKITDPAGNVLERTYLPNGKVGSETMTEVGANGARQVTKRAFHYDRENRLSEAVDDSDPARRLVRSYVRDVRGNVVKEIDPAGRVTTFAYDVRANKISQIDPDGGQTRFEYDSETNRLMAVVDPRGGRTEYTYDTFGNVATETRPGGATWTYVYDANNNLTTVTDPNGTVTTHEYDADDRWVGYAISRGTGVGGATSVTVTLDGAGRPIATATNEGVKTFHAWDSLDRELLTEMEIANGTRRRIGRSFDSTGNVIGVDYPSGLALTYERDHVGQIAAIRQTAAADPIVRYGYVGERILSKATSNSTMQTRSYDPYRRVTELVDRVSGSALRHSEYERSTAGDKVKVTRTALGSFDTFAYNARSRIVEEKLRTPLDPAIVDPTPEVVTLYDPDRNLNYDSITTYNRTPAGTAVDAIKTITDARNQYTSFGAETLGYDGNGNVISRASGAMQLQYDFRNRLVRATGPSGTVENLYDANGVKVQETRRTAAGTMTREYIHQDGRLLEEYVNGTLDARYVRGTDVDEIVRAEQSTAGNGTLDLIVYPVQDELGNVELLADAAGESLERYAFDGYGKFHVFGQDGQELPASAYGWRWLFQGREYVSILGAYDFRARVLWPDLGRFNSEDPLGQAPQNLYAAFDGNWQSKRDPDGLEVTIDETYPTIDRGRLLPYNRKNGTAAHKAWQIWVRANRRTAVALGRNFYTDNWIKTIAGDLGIEPFCCERTRPDAARLEHTDSVTLWELKPETYDKSRFNSAGSRALLAAAQLLKYRTALRMKATLGFGSELNKAHFEHDFITVIPGDDGGYRMYAYSVSEARGMIYYELEAQKKRKKNAAEKAFEAIEEMEKAAAKYGIIPVGGFAPGGAPVPVLIR